MFGVDYGARMFLTRGFPQFTTADPLTEQRYFSTPYGYCLGNPVVNIDLHGLIDWKVVGNGALQTVRGVFMVAGGVSFSVGTGGVGAALGGGALTLGGVTTAGFGITKMIMGFASDGSENMNATIQQIPESMWDFGGMWIDQVMENENGEARSAMKVVDGVTGIATGNPAKTIKGAFEMISGASQVAEGATELFDASKNSSIDVVPTEIDSASAVKDSEFNVELGSDMFCKYYSRTYVKEITVNTEAGTTTITFQQVRFLGIKTYHSATLHLRRNKNTLRLLGKGRTIVKIYRNTLADPADWDWLIGYYSV